MVPLFWESVADVLPVQGLFEPGGLECPSSGASISWEKIHE